MRQRHSTQPAGRLACRFACMRLHFCTQFALLICYLTIHCVGLVGLQVKGLVSNREALVDALSPLGQENVVGGEGAIYLFAKLPEGEHVQWFSGCLRDWHFGMLA